MGLSRDKLQKHLNDWAYILEEEKKMWLAFGFYIHVAPNSSYIFTLGGIKQDIRVDTAGQLKQAVMEAWEYRPKPDKMRVAGNPLDEYLESRNDA